VLVKSALHVHQMLSARISAAASWLIFAIFEAFFQVFWENPPLFKIAQKCQFILLEDLSVFMLLTSVLMSVSRGQCKMDHCCVSVTS
jgi:hypothetical protein